MSAPKHPRDRDAALSAAFLRLTGATQDAAAEAAGVSPRTLRNWEAAPWWDEIETEARGRWLKGIESATRAAIAAFISTDPSTARFAAERLLPEFRPPKMRQELEHRGPVAVATVPAFVEDPDEFAAMVRQQRELAAARSGKSE